MARNLFFEVLDLTLKLENDVLCGEVFLKEDSINNLSISSLILKYTFL